MNTPTKQEIDEIVAGFVEVSPGKWEWGMAGMGRYWLFILTDKHNGKVFCAGSYCTMVDRWDIKTVTRYDRCDDVEQGKRILANDMLVHKQSGMT